MFYSEQSPACLQRSVRELARLAQQPSELLQQQLVLGQRLEHTGPVAPVLQWAAERSAKAQGAKHRG